MKSSSRLDLSLRVASGSDGWSDRTTSWDVPGDLDLGGLDKLGGVDGLLKRGWTIVRCDILKAFAMLGALAWQAS
uniref:Uncharacterized protein n=1 Tax=Zea mays TaxID=4577 RepID=A0A804RFG9_MAIZE